MIDTPGRSLQSLRVNARTFRFVTKTGDAVAESLKWSAIAVLFVRVANGARGILIAQ